MKSSMADRRQFWPAFGGPEFDPLDHRTAIRALFGEIQLLPRVCKDRDKIFSFDTQTA